MGLLGTASWSDKGMVRSKGKNGTIHYYAKPSRDARPDRSDRSKTSSHRSSSSYHYPDDYSRRRLVHREDVRSVTSYQISDYSERGDHHLTQERRIQQLEEELKSTYRSGLRLQEVNSSLQAELDATQVQLDNSQAQLQAVQEQLRWAEQRYQEDTLRWEDEKQHQERENSSLRQQILSLKDWANDLLSMHGRERGRPRSAERRSRTVYHSPPPTRASPSSSRDSSYYPPRTSTTTYRDPKDTRPTSRVRRVRFQD
ncbi:hypothetical protein DL546_006534 [Coniochaeta pulveracea]|uniref:Uncharacterized protein n=1 Tax=Coniochaeta pulveracea TaxID=177199 RepID=A0A420YBZ2_9PEZI|nr:hypothetical protein DL546_006534 [Coniochaeta pulveracea]